ncbi:MAG: glycosyltransferase, partial [Promethearchaeota archaeon]
ALTNLIKKYDMTEHIRLLGRLKRKQLLEYMRSSDVFIMNSSYEGLSHTIIEAMGCEIPIIATKIGGNKELIRHHWNGLLVDYNEKPQLEEAIRTIIENKVLAKNLVENGKKTYKKFTWENHIEKLLVLFHEIIQDF